MDTHLVTCTHGMASLNTVENCALQHKGISVSNCKNRACTACPVHQPLLASAQLFLFSLHNLNLRSYSLRSYSLRSYSLQYVASLMFTYVAMYVHDFDAKLLKSECMHAGYVEELFHKYYTYHRCLSTSNSYLQPKITLTS